MKKNAEVDRFLQAVKMWREEMLALRSILLETELNEGWKWRQPCYTWQNKNIAIIGGFKAFCALSFFKGALLKDEKAVLVAPGENSQASRLFRFTNVQEIIKLKPIILAYIDEAIALEKAGKKVQFKAASPSDVPEELNAKFDSSPAFKQAFYALTPGRQRGYLLYFAAPKQSSTRSGRIENYEQRILDGKGIHDCVCGLSKRFPRCDGSHKFAK